MSEQPVTSDEYPYNALQTTYIPPSYALLDSNKEGKWFELGSDAIVWTNYLEGAGIVPLHTSPEVERLRNHFMNAKDSGMSATMAYALALRSVPGAKETLGSLQLASARLEQMKGQ